MSNTFSDDDDYSTTSDSSYEPDMNDYEIVWENIFILSNTLLSSDKNLLLDMRNPNFHDEFNNLISIKTGVDIDLVSQITDTYFQTELPRRSEKTTTFYSSEYKSKLRQIMSRNNKINKTCSNQGTDEWFLERSKYITASSAYQCLEDPTKNKYRQTFIKKKVKTIRDMMKKNENENENENMFTSNLENPMERGHRYEQAVINVYSFINNTIVDEFGCIPHKTHDFLAASPDGINNDPSSPLYGRMLEIKCVKSRKITGIPKKDYWVQMQHQMECCDLDEVDFVETKPVEIKEDEFIREACCETPPDKHYGVLIIFQSKKSHYPFYVYYPYNRTYDIKEIKTWEDNTFNKYNKEYEYINIIYYKFEVFSTVLVKRNREWFKAALPYYQSSWNEITDIIQNKKEIEQEQEQEQDNTVKVIKFDI